MPIINVKLIEDVFTPDQKREIIERLTDAMVSIEGENLRPVTWVVVEEVASGDMGVGGKPLRTSRLCRQQRHGCGAQSALQEAQRRLLGDLTPRPFAVQASIGCAAPACRADGPGSRPRAHPRCAAPPPPCARCRPGAP